MHIDSFVEFIPLLLEQNKTHLMALCYYPMLMNIPLEIEIEIEIEIVT
jgi:hypothetical protein